MEIIDAHAHVYPNKIAEKATKAIGEFYDIEMQMSAGTPENLLLDGKKAGISRFVIHSVATTPHQVRSINDFIKAESDAHKEFIPFMTLHQDLSQTEVKEEIKRCIDLGFKGIKLHPDFQKFYIDQDSVQVIYEIASDKLPILFHVGDNRYEYSAPERLVKMAKKFPNVNFIGAHFGGYRKWDNALIYKGLKNVYFDTCSSLAFISSEKAKEIIDLLGADRFFFATDFPMWDATNELERFNKIPLTNQEREMIFSKNIKKLLKL